MAREATAWSVKGIDQATRDIARRAAHAAGMTIGEWIDHAIKSDAANRGVPVPRGSAVDGAAPPPRPDGISRDTAEAIFSRITDGEQLFEARLRPIAYALKDVAERVVALEQEVGQLPAPEGRQPDAGSRGARTPIELRPVTPDRTPAADPVLPAAQDPYLQDHAWSGVHQPSSTPVDPPRPAVPAADGDGAAATARPRPKPIEFRPVPAPGTARAPEASAPPDPRGRETPPEGPPADWRPDPDLDREALSRLADATAGRGHVDPDPVAPFAPPGEPLPPEEDFPVDLVEDDPTTLRHRPEPVPPASDFPADPIDTRAVGLSGEPMPTRLPPRRAASRARLAIAAVIAVALVGGAVWTAHRDGKLDLDAVVARLMEAEHSVHRALSDATDWVVARILPPPQPGSAPAADSAPPAPQVAVAPREPSPTEPSPTEPSPTEPSPTGEPADSAQGGMAESGGQEPAASESGSAAPPAASPAPPLPDTPIAVNPRPAAPPPAPTLDPRPTQTARATTDTPATEEPGATRPEVPPSLRRAEAGNPAAQFEVAAGMMRAAEPRPAEAATWFREAAINGLDVAQFNLGAMYERGLGVPEDETRALLWYHSAAEQGHPLAQYNLGRLYALGKGIPQSDAEAKRWFQRAADRGVAAALHALATFETDEIAREQTMHRAAKAGDPLAQAWLRARSAGETPGAALGAAASLVLDPPSGAPDVAAIQQGLADLGYYTGPIDGIAGPQTRAAIGRFQSDNGLPATGLPSRSLRQRLN